MGPTEAMGDRPTGDPEALRGLMLVPMAPGDIADVHAIEVRAYPYPWSPGIFADCLRADYEGRLLVTRGRELRGYALWSWGVGEAHLLNLCVDPYWQGRGLGRHLLEACLDEIACHDVERVLLEVRESNHAAIALYEARGFRRIGRRKAYYPDPGGREDAWVMALDVRRRTGPSG